MFPDVTDILIIRINAVWACTQDNERGWTLDVEPTILDNGMLINAVNGIAEERKKRTV